MRHFFERRGPGGLGLALWVVVGMAFIAPMAVLGLRDVRLENNVGDWLEPNNLQARKFRWLEKQFPHEDAVLASWDDSQIGDPRIEQFAEKLQGKVDSNGRRRGGLPFISKVRTPLEVLDRMEENDVTRDESLERLSGVLISAGKLRLILSETGKHREKAARAKIVDWAKLQLGLNVEVVDKMQDKLLTDTEDATDEEKLDEVLASQHDLRVSWAGMKPGIPATIAFQEAILDLRFEDTDGDQPSEPIVEDAFFYPGAPVAIVIYINEAGMADKGEAIRSIRAAAEEVGIAPETLHLSGGAVAASALNQAVIKSSWNKNFPLWMLHHRSVMLLSGLVGLMLTFYMMRSFRLGMMVLAVSYFTPLVTVALVPLTGGSMNMVLIVMPTLLLMLTISGSIHIGNYWKHAAARDMRTAVVQAVEMARKPCILASVTTIIGLLSLATSHLTPVRDFGLYSAAGMLISLVMVLYALPSLLQLWPPKQPKVEETEHLYWRGLANWITDHSTIVTCVFLLACVASTAGLAFFRTETKVIKYFPESAQVYQDYAFLEENLAGVVPVQVVAKFSDAKRGGPNFAERAKLVRELQAKIAQLSDVSGTMSLADFLPTPEPLPEDASRLQRLQEQTAARAMETRVKEDKNRQAQSFLIVADEKTDFSEPGDELWKITAQVAVLTDVDYGDLMAQMDQISAETLRLEPTAGHIVTGMVPLFLETQQEVLHSLITSFGLAFVMIGCVLMVVLRHPLAGFFAMLPNVLPIGMVFGMISWFRVPVDIGTMITASVALGIAVDGTVHLLTWFRTGIFENLTRKQSIAQALEHCGPAMFQTSVVTSLGLIVLYPAELLLISRFGWLMASLIGMALIADVILLPALLAGPLGTFIERQVQKSMPTIVRPEPAPPATSAVSLQPHINTSRTSISRRRN